MKNVQLASMLVLTLSFTPTALLAGPPNPGQCPNVNAIKNAGLLSAEADPEDGVYVAGQINNYGTQATWAFVIGIPMSGASSEEDALNKARAALPNLSGNPQPIPYQDKWLCLYNDLPNGYKAIAVEPISLKAMTHSSLLRVKP